MRALFLVAPVLLVATGSSQTVLLRFRPPVGKSVAYTMTMNMSQTVPNMPTSMNFGQSVPMTMRAVSRKGNLTTMETKTGQAKVSMPAGSPMAAGKAAMEKATSGITTTTVVDEFGSLKSAGASAMGRSMASGMMSGAQGVSYPARALRVGNSWGATLDLGKIMGKVAGGMKASGKIPIVYRLVGLEKHGATTVARISLSMKGITSMNMGASEMKFAMNSNGTLLVDAGTGLLQSMSTTTLTDMNMGGTMGTMHQKMTMTMKAR